MFYAVNEERVESPRCGSQREGKGWSVGPRQTDRGTSIQLVSQSAPQKKKYPNRSEGLVEVIGVLVSFAQQE